jgi:parvulin-like peptidyl-prolyl isomerase
MRRGDPLLLLACVCLGLPAALAATVNRIVAVVNEDAITETDVTAYLSAVVDEGGWEPKRDEMASMRQAALLRLIDQRLIVQHAKASELRVDTDDVLRHLERLQARFGSAEAFEASLAESGLSREQLKTQMRDQLLAQHAIDAKVRTTIMVSPQEVARELAGHPELVKGGDRVRGAHLLIRANEGRSLEQARELAGRLREQLARGASFAGLARRYSETPEAEAGGDLGWVAQGELMPELEAALFSLEPGQVSDPLETKLGVHLLKMEERRTAESLSATDAHRAIYQRLYQQRFEAALSRWLEALRRNAYIELLEPKT